MLTERSLHGIRTQGPDRWMKSTYIWECELLQNMAAAIKLLRQSFTVKFLSASVSPEASEEKKKYLRKNLGEDIDDDEIVIVPYGEEKTKYADPVTGLLLDDHSPNLIEWESKGGKAIKVRNNCNAKGGKWRGNSVHYMQTPESIARAVLAQAFFES